jgi:hypothetical protein
MNPTIAYVLGRRWDVLAYNDTYAAVVGEHRHQRN